MVRHVISVHISNLICPLFLFTMRSLIVLTIAIALLPLVALAHDGENHTHNETAAKNTTSSASIRTGSSVDSGMMLAVGLGAAYHILG